MKRKKILALLLALSMLLPLLPVTTFAADVTDIYVNSETGADTAAGTSTAPVKTLAKAYEKVSDGGTIYITSDITLDNESIFNINRDKAITIASVDSSKIYTIGDNGSATTINNNAIILLNITAGKVTLKNVTIDGTNSLGSSGTGVNEFLVMVQNAELILDSGATVQNGKAGGILATNSKLTLNDGATVTANTKGYFSVDASSYKYAGGIGVTNGSTFVMNGGKITGNSTQSDGSGINISGNSNGSAVINGGEISGNSSSSGGALNLDADSSLTINGGTIQNNTVTAGSSTDGAVNIKGALTIGGEILRL